MAESLGNDSKEDYIRFEALSNCNKVCSMDTQARLSAKSAASGKEEDHNYDV